MTKIHAVIYINDRTCFLATDTWEQGDGFGIRKLVDPNLGGDLATRELWEFAEENAASLSEFHTIHGESENVPFEDKLPRLLIFRFAGENWVARGFMKWGRALSGDNRVRVLASSGDSEGDDGYNWCRSTGRLLRAITLNESARDSLNGQGLLDILPELWASGSIAVVAENDVANTFDTGDAADFGDAQDSRN